MDHEEKLARLRTYLSRVAPEGELEALAEAGDPLESLGLEGVTDEEGEVEAAAVRELAQGGDVDTESMWALEAIILPKGRPVIDIINDTYHRPPPPWRHLGNKAIRKRIEGAIPSVGRIEVPDHPSLPYAGTGFVVGRNLLMTNRHVAEIFAFGLGTRNLVFKPGLVAGIDFKREVVPSEEIYLAVAGITLIHDGFDMALLRVEGLPPAQSPLLLSTTHPDDLVGREVAVVGYPAQSAVNDLDLQNKIFRGVFNVKRLQPGTLMGTGQTDSYGREVVALTHDSSTLGGNSGSAVIDLKTGMVVGLHFKGCYLKANYAVPTYELAADRAVSDQGVNFVGALPTPATPPAPSPGAATISGSAGAIPETDEDEEKKLQELDSTVIMEPLLSHMRKASPGTIHNVVVELNLRHPNGQKETKKQVLDYLRERVSGKDGTPEYTEGQPYLFERKSELGGHYVFADLTTQQIEDLDDWSSDPETAPEKIYKIWEDFGLELYLDRSVSTVKADAARVAFGATGERIVWAVVDSGVKNHRHFKKHENLDLTGEGLKHWDFTTPEPKEITELDQLTDEVGHGTHVAGIIAGETVPEEGEEKIRAVVFRKDKSGERQHLIRTAAILHGVAPRCKIVSLKVVSPNQSRRKHGLSRDLMTALAHIRDVNGDGPVPRIHGVNISLGHEFDPEWFACGSSPVCRAVDALVKSGVTVVVAAGNGGYGEKVTQFKGTFEGGLQLTIRDPGNSSLAITVGATHAYMPHTYGVSYFSAKGPTGDGRLKPDLVAPGEKIVSCAVGGFADQAWVNGKRYDFIEQSGTSMAAPHVSGCIAAFLSLRHEFRTEPEKVKAIFLANATDLGRERYFQGHGLVDLMRAVQSV